ncbi:galactosyltransferase domain-containing protein [Ditylenchus destructor]|nr:galactosyltransferase domain-containing protein [Ditylenchus destructor]
MHKLTFIVFHLTFFFTSIICRPFEEGEKVLVDHNYGMNILLKAHHPEFYRLPLSQLDQITPTKNVPSPHELNLRYSNENWTFYTQEPSEKTKEACKSAKLLVIVYEIPERFEVRDAIRKSWAKNLSDGVVFKFIVGMRENATDIKMLEELQQHDDLILNTLYDSYRTLFLKVGASFHWHQTFCPSARYLLKTDDDITVHMSRLQYWIDKRLDSIRTQYPAVIFGTPIRDGKPHRNTSNKNYITLEEWPKEVYPDYTSGSSYLLSDEAVKRIVATTVKVHSLPIEDVFYTGIVAEEAKIARVDASKVLYPRTQRSVGNASLDCFDNVPLLSACNYFWNNMSEPALHSKYLEDLSTLKCSDDQCFYTCKDNYVNKEINIGAGQRLIDAISNNGPMLRIVIHYTFAIAILIQIFSAI